MSTLAEYMIVAGAENRPPMLDKTMYNSWQSRMFLYLKGKKNSRMMLESIQSRPLVYPTIEENGQVRDKKYAELTKQEKLQDDCDVQALNIVLQGLPPDVYYLVSHYNGTEFVNQTLQAYNEDVGISHQTSVAHTPQKNGVVEIQNRTLVEAARTMLIFSKALLFLWAEAVLTSCFTQNRSLIRKHHNKSPYELLYNRKPDLSYIYVFGALCYPTNDSEDLGKLKPKADIGIFIGYAPAKKAF
ncbi:retrovirus-related pol polyprotein from transposon TNT 1-94 [Tanacetum coccineum]